jgi:hypothetical protein
MNSHLPISGSVSEFDVAILLAQMHRQGLQGQLKIAAAQFTKTLWLENGCIVFAQSSLAEDSLGRFLLRRGVINEAQYEKSRRRMQKNRSRHGRALMEMGLLTPEQMWDDVSSHLRAIAFSLFPLRAGRYDIISSPEDASENIRIELPVPQAILEGVRLIVDEEFIESRFEPNMALYPAPDKLLPGAALKPHEAHVLSLVSDGCEVDEVVRRSELLRFNTLKVLYALRRLGLVCDSRQPARPATPSAAFKTPTTFTSFEETLQYYNDRFEYIYRVLSKEIGPVAQSILSDSITAILESIPPCFHSLEIRPDGRVDEKSVLKSIWYENFEENSSEFLRGLEEILYAEIYAVKRHLGKDHERLILRWIREPGN